MANPRSRCGSGEDEIDYGALRARAMYPDLIGRKVEADKFTPFFMKCGCGMLVMTSRELALQETTCENCKANAEKFTHNSAAPATGTLSRRSESRTLFLVVVFCLVVAGAMGARMWDAPPRAQAMLERLD